MSMDRPIRLPWWRRKLWLQWGVAAVAAALLISIAVLFLGTPERSLRVAVASITLGRVLQGPFHDFIPLRGKVVPMNTVYLDALEGGRIDRILALAGDMVEEGQPLVELSNTELELDVLDREGRLVESITQLQTYETQLEQNRVANQKALALIDYDVTRLERSVGRRAILVADDAEPVEVKDQVQDELTYDLKVRPMQDESNRRQEALRVQQLPQIHSQLIKLQQDLKITRGKLDNLTVRAPVAGRLTALDLKVGENRNRGERFGEITPETGFKLAAEVDEYYLGRVQNGQTADIEMADKTWTLKVTRVYPKVTNGTFTVDFAFQGTTPAGLLPGQALQGKLALGADRMATILPAGAFLDRSGGDWIFVLTKDGRSALRRTIKIGRRNTEQVEVLSGLAVGEQAIISDYTGLERIDRIDLKP
ncbi:MAG: HlyD family efflux transporter periplasmic adaptor subunit [Steroidobacteraceae bacterium]